MRAQPTAIQKDLVRVRHGVVLAVPQLNLRCRERDHVRSALFELATQDLCALEGSHLYFTAHICNVQDQSKPGALAVRVWLELHVEQTDVELSVA